MPSNLSRINDAHNRREAFLELHGKSRLLEIKLLYEIHQNKDYVQLGFETFKDYWEAPRDSGGLDISRSWAHELIETYRKYVVELHQPESILEDVSPRKLYYLKGQVTAENVEEIVNKAKNTQLSDLVLERSGVNEADCEHTQVEFYSKCGSCHRWIPYRTRSEISILRELLEQQNEGDSDTD